MLPCSIGTSREYECGSALELARRQFFISAMIMPECHREFDDSFVQYFAGLEKAWPITEISIVAE